jgi:multiple RNA-binding domain-containing protein 1
LKRKRDEAENDPKLKEFLNVMQPPSKLKSWANEDSLLASESIPMAEPVEAITSADVDSDGEYQVISKKATAAQDVKTSSAETQNLPTPVVKAVKPVDEDEEMMDIGELPQASAGDGGPVSDADWLRSRTNRVLDLVEDGEGPTRPVAQPTTAPDEQIKAPDIEVEPTGPSKPEEIEVEEVIPSEEDKIRQTGRLYLRNLHFDITEDDIRDHFSKHGSLEEVRLFSPFLHRPTVVMMNSQDRDN